MENIKVEEYVRINNDNRNCIGIGKATKILNDVIYVDMNNKYILPVSFKIENIKKHSFNLIDLIEVKDIVVMLDTKFNTKDYIFIDDKEMLKAVKEDLKDRCKLLEVLTHEQFKANCYKIEQK